ncbi:hypothetical protein BDY21DRAFT_356080 [Lineolata rhizophorae]|uniref:Uncharacterized protein n=1 Tax=Lineolata rhizophorae TaxID=578093 RepID=A0A6A6NNY7_9PEZI|nr:hypothetical protein BDY21DRAFT_356080 [Lineolata rhizophorae]
MEGGRTTSAQAGTGAYRAWLRWLRLLSIARRPRCLGRDVTPSIGMWWGQRYAHRRVSDSGDAPFAARAALRSLTPLEDLGVADLQYRDLGCGLLVGMSLCALRRSDCAWSRIVLLSTVLSFFLSVVNTCVRGRRVLLPPVLVASSVNCVLSFVAAPILFRSRVFWE